MIFKFIPKKKLNKFKILNLQKKITRKHINAFFITKNSNPEQDIVTHSYQYSIYYLQ